MDKNQFDTVTSKCGYIPQDLQEIYQLEKEIAQLQKEKIVQDTKQIEIINYIHHPEKLNAIKQNMHTAVEKEDFPQVGCLVQQAERLQKTHTQLASSYLSAGTTGEAGVRKSEIKCAKEHEKIDLIIG